MHKNLFSLSVDCVLILYKPFEYKPVNMNRTVAGIIQT